MTRGGWYLAGGLACLIAGFVAPFVAPMPAVELLQVHGLAITGGLLGLAAALIYSE